jgi:KDO2-lipid IV(A) lauroyltransferase
MPPHPTADQASAVSLLHPRHWPTWIGLGVMRLTSLLPLPVLAAGGVVIGELLYYLVSTRRHVVAVNIRLCFPGLSAREQKRVAKRHFHAFGQTLLDIGVAWWGRPARLRRVVHIRGREHAEALIAEGKSIILMAPHFLGLEMGGIRISLEGSGCAVFRPVDNRVLNTVVEKARTRFGLTLVSHRAPLTTLVRMMRDGLPLFYLPDQDPHRRSRAFVPFFGVPAATFTSLSRLAEITEAKVIPCICRQLPRGHGYEVLLRPPLANFPSGDPVEDAARMNREIEREVRESPAQYFWMHKRFKTRPPGQPKVY